jgi:nitrilase
MTIVRVAAVQATPVHLDADATVDKAIGLLGAAADEGAQLVVLPECFVSVYPSFHWASRAAGGRGFDELWRRMWDSSVDVRGPLVQKLVAACRERSVHLSIGVNEREDDRPGTIYNTSLLLGPSGVLHRHRKLMPTMHERLFHGIGAGDDLGVVDVPGIGRVGGLTCWENRMPLARWAVYEQGPQLWLAPSADDSDGWLASMRHIGIEGGVFVVSVAQYLPRSSFAADFPVEITDGVAVLGRGGTAVIDPQGEVIAGPLYDEEGMLLAECDLDRILEAKRWFDASGHYSRRDVLLPGERETRRSADRGGGLPLDLVVDEP